MRGSEKFGQSGSGTVPNRSESVYFLGGRDLEMVEIARVLAEHSIPFFDHALDWSYATFAAYEEEIRSSISNGHRPVLIELRDIPAEVLPFIEVIDHHGPESGHLPTSLEMVLARLGVTALTREQQLIAANDKGYIDGMAAIGATNEEILRIREQDRCAQGITQEQELAATTAIAALSSTVASLTVVQLPHGKTATVTDRLSHSAGGPGYDNLMIECPKEISFFGNGLLIRELMRHFGGYCGGQLPKQGYWGIEILSDEMHGKVRDFVTHYTSGQ